MSTVFAEYESGKIRVYFSYDPYDIVRIKNVPSARFQPMNERNQRPHWIVSAKLEMAAELRKQFGERLRLGPKLREWARREKREREQLVVKNREMSADLPRLKKEYTTLWRMLHLGPRGRWMTRQERLAAYRGEGSFQTGDTRFMADCPNPLNANQPGLGKTLETIGAVLEGGMTGPVLVVAPLTAVETVWADHLGRLQRHPVLVATGPPQARQGALQQAARWAHQGQPYWLVVNPDVVRYRNRKEPDEWGGHIMVPEPVHEEFFHIDWCAHILDEFHMMGMGNTRTLTHQAMRSIKAQKRIALSGTPMGGKPIKLFHILQWLEPEQFSNKMHFAQKWLEVVNLAGRVDYGDVRQNKKEEFSEFLARYMVRRLKSDVLTWLPLKQIIDIDVKMGGKQAEQYREFADLAEVKIEEEHLTAVGILAEYTRLRQFAVSTQRVERVTVQTPDGEEDQLRLYPVLPSCKLEALLEILGELGLNGRGDLSDEQVVVFSQFRTVVDMVCDELNKRGIPAEKIHGGIKAGDRTDAVRRFQAKGNTRVMVLQTLAGGVAITLDKATNAVFLDETWDPDNQEQAEDRVHRASSIGQVTCFYIRSQNTIETRVRNINIKKKQINFDILDARSNGLRA